MDWITLVKEVLDKPKDAIVIIREIRNLISDVKELAGLEIHVSIGNNNSSSQSLVDHSYVPESDKSIGNNNSPLQPLVGHLYISELNESGSVVVPRQNNFQGYQPNDNKKPTNPPKGGSAVQSEFSQEIPELAQEAYEARDYLADRNEQERNNRSIEMRGMQQEEQS